MPRPLSVPAVPHYLALLRAGLGLTQAQLAAALHVSRQFISQVEAGQRVLPPGPAQAVQWLAQALAAAPPAAEPPAAAGPLAARAAAVAYETQRLGRQRERGQARTRRATNWLQAAPRLLATVPATADAVRQRLWLAATTAGAEEALEGEGSPAQHQLLAARLAGLRAEAAVLAGYLGAE